MSLNQKKENAIKVFGMTNQLLNAELSRIESEYSLDLDHTVRLDAHDHEQYYSQFDLAVRQEASEMMQHFEIFYCLEKSIRQLINDTMEDAEDTGWWSGKRVTTHLKEAIEKRIKREKDSGITLRSSDPLDFTTFGELSGIITVNWDIFGGILNSPKAVERIMSNLNSLRGPIAHCSPLAEDEVLRLRLLLRDWFRQME